jgi:hypothetical protein
MTRPGTTPEQGDIALIDVPFSDLSTTKARPVIVSSNDRHHRTQSDMPAVRHGLGVYIFDRLYRDLLVAARC